MFLVKHRDRKRATVERLFHEPGPGLSQPVGEAGGIDPGIQDRAFAIGGNLQLFIECRRFGDAADIERRITECWFFQPDPPPQEHVPPARFITDFLAQKGADLVLIGLADLQPDSQLHMAALDLVFVNRKRVEITQIGDQFDQGLAAIRRRRPQDFRARRCHIKCFGLFVVAIDDHMGNTRDSETSVKR